MVTLTCGMTPSARVGCEHGANGIDSGIEPPSNLAIGAFQRPVARRSGIEFLGKARAVGAERVQLVVQRLFAAVGFVPPFDGGSQPIAPPPAPPPPPPHPPPPPPSPPPPPPPPHP